MVSAEVKDRLEVASSFMEVVKLEVDNSETFESRFGNILGAHITPQRAHAAADSISVTVSGQTVTFQLVGTTTNVTVLLTVYGRN